MTIHHGDIMTFDMFGVLNNEDVMQVDWKSESKFIHVESHKLVPY